jgi:SpoVK/Ycf46/Vps4 family AAA+-type ATPase
MNTTNTNIITIKIFQLAIFAYIPANFSEYQIYTFGIKNMKILSLGLNGLILKKRSIFLCESFFRFRFCLFYRKRFETTIINSDKRNSNFEFCEKMKTDTNHKPTDVKVLKKKILEDSYYKRIVINPIVRYIDFAGINRILKQIQELIEWPLRHYKIYQKLKVSPSKGILLYGQPGTGKTFLAHVIAGELNIPIINVTPSEFVSSMIGNSEKKIRSIFNYAEKNAPCIVFIDEIDGIAQSRDFSAKEVERRTIGQLLISIDNIRTRDNAPVFIIAATNQVEHIDQAFRRPGRFDHEIKLEIPNQSERFLMLIHFVKHIKLSSEIDLIEIARKTKGFVSGDLSALIKNIYTAAISRICTTTFKGQYRLKNDNFLFDFTIKLIDFEKGFTRTEPVLLRQGFLNIQEIFWNQIGALYSIRMVLSKYIIEPIKKFSKLGYVNDKGIGVLLYGPPGCGKTLIAQATACESSANYIAIKGPEILDKFLGESEKTIRLIFSRARSCAPTIIFFDEIDSITAKRCDGQMFSQNGVSDRIVNQLLTEMDGVDKKKLVYIIGATNRPEIIDRAFLRPGRIDKLLFVPFPTKREKIQILLTISRKISILPYLNFDLLSQVIPHNYSGADLVSLTKEAVLINSDKRIGYISLVNSTNGLFNILNYFICIKDYFAGFNKIKKISYIRKI